MRDRGDRIGDRGLDRGDRTTTCSRLYRRIAWEVRANSCATDTEKHSHDTGDTISPPIYRF